MAEQFPSIKPTNRRFSVGQFPTKSYRALSGATVRRSFGNKPYGYELRLEFENRTDTITAQLIAHYNSTSGGFERFTLPDNLFAGMDATLKGLIQAPNSIKWEYASPPEIESVYSGLSSISITLIGEVNY